MPAMRARGCATGLTAMSISQRRDSESTHQTTLALTPGLHNKAVPIFIELPLCRTGIGGSSSFPPPIFPGIPVATPRDSSMKTFETPRTVDVRGKKYRLLVPNCDRFVGNAESGSRAVIGTRNSIEVAKSYTRRSISFKF